MNNSGLHMQINVTINNSTETFDLTELGAKYSGVINIGRKCKQVWNTIALDSESIDTFQCHLIGSGDSWRLEDGQERTECPKGLLSSKMVSCNGCLGRCVNIHAGRPKYYKRTPESPTLINGESIGQCGTQLKAGNVITIDDVTMSVSL